ncbi:MAG: hypothetical protein HY028_02255 [Gammaproteobacteria bacterium]|nr:hypothetical protein [Gammaproteobacteria bacterium]
MNRVRKYLAGLVAVLGVVAIAGYLAWQSTITDEERVGERAVERWHALMAGDFKKAYGYLGPGYRSATPYAAYEAKLKSGLVEWKKAELKSVKCQPELCTVELGLDYRPMVKGFEEYQMKNGVTEKWVKVDSQWWYIP